MTPQTLAEKVADVEARVRFLEQFLPQIMAHINKANTFFDKHEEKEEVLEKVQSERHKENKDRLDAMNVKISIAAFTVGVASFIVAVLGIWVMIKLANHSLSDVIHIFTTTAPTVAKSVMSRY
jgi:hypothetical protein